MKSGAKPLEGNQTGERSNGMRFKFNKLRQKGEKRDKGRNQVKCYAVPRLKFTVMWEAKKLSQSSREKN